MIRDFSASIHVKVCDEAMEVNNRLKMRRGTASRTKPIVMIVTCVEVVLICDGESSLSNSVSPLVIDFRVLTTGMNIDCSREFSSSSPFFYQSGHPVHSSSD